MIPPKTVSILDRHGGATAETTKAHRPFPPGYDKSLAEHLNPPREPEDKSKIGATLWRPGHTFTDTTGTLIEGSVNEKGFYQLNKNVTSAKYKVASYRYPIVTWWDNLTGERIA